jgi:hypothetical protein
MYYIDTRDNTLWFIIDQFMYEPRYRLWPVDYINESSRDVITEDFEKYYERY